MQEDKHTTNSKFSTIRKIRKWYLFIVNKREAKVVDYDALKQGICFAFFNVI